MRTDARLISSMLIVSALTFAGCADGDDSTGSAPSTTEQITEQITEPTTTTTAAAAAAAAAAGDSEVTTDLPASFRGVTATSIKVGVAVPDFDALQQAGLPNYQGDAEVAFQAFFDAINADGGIFGRTIEPVYVGFDFVDRTTQDSACAKLTEDHEVFIVLYGLLGEANLCLTDLHDTMVMTRSFQTTALRERAGDALWLQLNAADDDRIRILASVLADSGRLDDKTVGIIGNDGEADPAALEEALTSLGHDSLLLFANSDGSDANARESSLRNLAQRLETEGVDFVFDLLGGSNAVEVFAESGYRPEFAYKALISGVDGVTDRSVIDRAVSVSEINFDAMFDKPDFQANCMDVVRDANPDLADEMSFLPTGDEQAGGQPTWINPIMVACDQTRLLKLIGDLAGAELTNDSFRAALDDLGPVELYGYGQASFGSESKWDGLDEFYLQEYDHATDTILIVGDPLVIDR